MVEPEQEVAFLHPLPVEKLWGVGVKTADKLHARGITTVGEVAQLPETVLVGMLGRASGRQLHALAHNRDPRRVTVGVRRRSIGGQRAIGRRGQPKTPEFLDEVLVGLIDRITRRLRAARRVAQDRDPAASLRRLLARDPLAHDRARRVRSRGCCSARRVS